MNSRKIAFLLIFIFCGLIACVEEDQFGNRQNRGPIPIDLINEASGLVASRRNLGVLWTHNDSGAKNEIYAISDRGKLLGIYEIDDAKNRDWEDIAIFTDHDGGHFILIADIGDNMKKEKIKTIYRVPEPIVSVDQDFTKQKISRVKKIKFRYPDGKHDSEAIFVDPKTEDLYVISKDQKRSKVYRIPSPQSTKKTIKAKLVAEFKIREYKGQFDRLVVASDLSADGRELLVKTYNAIYFWELREDRDLERSLQKDPKILPYVLEPQGEAICWSADGSGYFTLSESLRGVPIHLHFYPRIEE